MRWSVSTLYVGGLPAVLPSLTGPFSAAYLEDSTSIFLFPSLLSLSPLPISRTMILIHRLHRPPQRLLPLHRIQTTLFPIQE
jgi:hypothetical protein